MTPRRILLLVGGVIASVTVYLAYARLLGWLDGLPLLPDKMLAASDGTFRPPVRLTSPTINLLRLAFGENSPETEPGHYPTQLRFLQGDTLVALAAGSPPSNPKSTRVVLSPFSLAVFGKQRPEHLRRPGEEIEVTTVHSDKALLEFDREIQSVSDIGGAKLLRVELISDPEQAPPDPAKREGKVHITNNQRSADPARRLLLRTVGPVFYVDQKPKPDAPRPTGPDIWTDAAVEIVDRGNLPRPLEAAPARTPAAPAPPAELRTPAAVADVLAGRRLPPPTVTAVGMRVYLDHSDAAPAGAPKNPADKGGGFRRINFLEKVVMNLWVEGGQGLVVSGKETAEPTPGAAAVGGGLVPGAHTARASALDLLQVETRGPFFYDSDKHLARFDVLPLSDPNLPNDVQVTKVSARGGVQTLFSQVLELEFNGPATGESAAKSKPAAPATPESTEPGGGGKLKRVHAWTYTPGRYLTIGSDADQLEAHGQDLDHDAAARRTRLTGGPLYAVQKRSVLTAGTPKQSAVLTIEPAPGTTGPDRKNQSKVDGPGRFEMYDAASKANTAAASWATSMVQTRETIDGRALDLYTFTDGAKFEDLKSDYWLKGNVLKLWLGPRVPPPGEPDPQPAQSPGRDQPQRLLAIGNVTGHSGDLDIEHADTLDALFRDDPPPAEPEVAAPVSPAAPAPTPAPVANGPPKAPLPKEPEKKEPEKAKPPMKLKARKIDTWVARHPAPKAAAAATPPAAGANPPADETMKYRIEEAYCEGMVSAHRDAADPTKPRVTNILGSRMLIESKPDGSILTVHGWNDRPGEVHHEGKSLIGPFLVIDELHNLAVVRGRGSLVWLSNSDLSGDTLKQPEPVVIHFRDGMTFYGAKKVADFFGKVNASQGGSWVTCHTMQVNFDRPVYFTPPKGSDGKPKPKDPKSAEDKPKIDVVSCYPAPADAYDDPLELQVVYTQVKRDPATGKPIGLQKIIARELQVRAQARDPDGGEPYKQVQAAGPFGVVRTWEPGSKDDDGTGPRPAPKAGDSPAEKEMKLTIVTFSGRMIGREKGPNYKDATFFDSVRVIQVPTDNPDLVVEQHKLPPKAVLLTCAEKLVVWSHKKGDGPAEQHMHAAGNAYLRNDEYDGWGDTIQNDGKKVTFFGMESVPARIKNRFSGNDQSGKKIIYDRATNDFSVDGGIGGTLNSSPSAPKKNPPPKQP